MKRHRPSLLGAIALTLSTALIPLDAFADAGFQKWIRDFYPTAAKAGITERTYRQAFNGVNEPDQFVLEKAAYQPEFKSEIWDYLDSRVNPFTVKVGQEMLAKHGRLLTALENHFGVDKHVLLAIWSMESN